MSLRERLTEILPGLLHSVDDAACRVLTEKLEVSPNA